MKEIKSSQNKAGQVETPQKNIESMPIVELVELQAQQYEQIINAQNAVTQAQNNLRTIKIVLDRRKKELSCPSTKK